MPEGVLETQDFASLLGRKSFQKAQVTSAASSTRYQWLRNCPPKIFSISPVLSLPNSANTDAVVRLPVKGKYTQSIRLMYTAMLFTTV